MTQAYAASGTRTTPDTPIDEGCRHRQKPCVPCPDAIRQPRDQEGRRDRNEVENRKQVSSRLRAPTTFHIGIGQPGVDAVVGGCHQREQRHEKPGNAAAPGQARRTLETALVGRLVPREHDPRTGQQHRHEGEDGERSAPTPVPRGKRHRYGGRQRGADLDAGRVDAGRAGGADGEVLLHRDRHEGSGEAHTDTDRPGEEKDERNTRRRGASESEDTDEQDRHGDRHSCSDSCAEKRSRGREEPHAQDRDRSEQPHDGMGRLQAVLYLRQEWADTDDLRPERECDEEEPGQYGGRAHSGIFSLVSDAAAESALRPRCVELWRTTPLLKKTLKVWPVAGQRPSSSRTSRAPATIASSLP